MGEIHDDAEINSVVEESDIEVSDVEIEKAQEELDELEKSMEVPEKFDSVEDYNELLLNVYSNEGLSNEDKVEIGKQCVESLNQSDLTAEEKAKANAEVASDVRALNNPDNSDWMEVTDDHPWAPLDIAFPDKMGLDYDKDITPIGRGSENVHLPDTGYRYGGEGGNNYTCEASDGHVPSLDERSLPKEYIPEKDREVHFDNERYCEAIDAISTFDSDPLGALDSINSMIEEINAERGTDMEPLDIDELEIFADKYSELQETEFADVRDELGEFDKEFTKYGVHGYAKPMEDTVGGTGTICIGGADQFNTALPEYMLKSLGIEY